MRKPQIGESIKITWLPPCINAQGSTNPYIGFSGIVDYHYDKTGFCVNSGTAILCVFSKKYQYKIIEP